MSQRFTKSVINMKLLHFGKIFIFHCHIYFFFVVLKLMNLVHISTR